MFAEVIDIYIHSISNSFGILFNSLLVFLILTNPHDNIRSYSLMLLNFAITDLTTCILAIFLEPRIIPYQDNILYISNGLCGYFGVKSCVIGYSFMLCLYSHINWSLLASFIYRLMAIFNRIPSRKQVVLFLLIFSIPTMFQLFILVPYFIGQWDFDFKPLVHEVHPDLDLTDMTVFGAGHISEDWRATVATAQVILPVFPISIIVCIIRYIIIRQLAQFKATMSENTARIHQSFLQALTFQAMTPLLYISGALMYISGQLGWIHHPVTEYGLFLSIGFIPILNPLFSLYYVTVYRKALISIVCRWKSSVMPQQHTISDFTFATDYATPGNGNGNGEANNALSNTSPFDN